MDVAARGITGGIRGDAHGGAGASDIDEHAAQVGGGSGKGEEGRARVCVFYSHRDLASRVLWIVFTRLFACIATLIICYPNTRTKDKKNTSFVVGSCSSSR